MCATCGVDTDSLNGNPVKNSSVRWEELVALNDSNVDTEKAAQLLEAISSFSYRTNQIEHQMKVT